MDDTVMTAGLLSRLNTCRNEDELLGVLGEQLRLQHPGADSSAAGPSASAVKLVRGPWFVEAENVASGNPREDAYAAPSGAPPVTRELREDGGDGVMRYAAPVRLGGSLVGILITDTTSAMSSEWEDRFERVAEAAAPYLLHFSLMKWAHYPSDRGVSELRADELRRARLAELVDGTEEFIGYSDAEGRIEYINPAGLRLLGVSETGQPEWINECHPPEEMERMRREILPAAVESGVWNGHTRLITPDGDVTVKLSLMALSGAAGTTVAFVARMQPLTESEETHEELSRYAFEDALTRVYNRRGIDRAIREAFEHPQTVSLGLILFDLDGFKALNDEYGHPAGDRILVVIAERVREISRAEDVVGRLGGDEFAVVLRNTSTRAAQALAERIRRSLHDPITLETPEDEASAEGSDPPPEITVSISIGVAVDGSREAADKRLYHAADTALYQAKERGNAICVTSANTAAPQNGDPE